MKLSLRGVVPALVLSLGLVTLTACSSGSPKPEASGTPTPGASSSGSSQPSSAPSATATSAAAWLAGQLQRGLVVQDGLPSYGASLDLFFAFQATGTQLDAAKAIVAAIQADPSQYLGAHGDQYAGAHGRLLTAVEAVGSDSRGFNGIDLVKAAEQLLLPTGRASDQSERGDYSDTVAQAWVVRGLAAAQSAKAADALAYLLRQQCTDGGFRAAEADDRCATAQESVDATAYAAMALAEAAKAKLAGAGDALTRAVDYLLTAQAGDGSFGAGGAGATANAASTGLAAAVLRANGEEAQAKQAVAWLATLQASDGAIAPDAAAKAAGESPSTLAQWQTATAQAVLGLG